jgi:hypothetical protein
MLYNNLALFLAIELLSREIIVFFNFLQHSLRLLELACQMLHKLQLQTDGAIVYSEYLNKC